MGNLLRDGVATLADLLGEHASEAVVYVRGAARLAIGATPGRSRRRVDSGDGIVELVETADWIVADADLEGLVPASGDRIEHTLGEATAVYEVLHVGGGVGCSSPMGPAGTLVRIHTKRVGELS